MEERKLKQLLSEMSLREKIGQMIQLTGIYFDEDAVLTGAVGEGQPPQWVIRYAGSVLGMIGAEKLRAIQKKYMKEHPHHIPLLFMADVIHGCRIWLRRWRGMPRQSLLLRGSRPRFLR